MHTIQCRRLHNYTDAPVISFDDDAEYIDGKPSTYEDLAALCCGGVSAIDYINRARELAELQTVYFEWMSRAYHCIYYRRADYTIVLRILCTMDGIHVEIAKVVGASLTDQRIFVTAMSMLDKFIWRVITEYALCEDIAREIFADLKEFEHLYILPRVDTVRSIDKSHAAGRAVLLSLAMSGPRVILPTGGYLMSTSREGARALVKWLSRIFPSRADFIPASGSPSDLIVRMMASESSLGAMISLVDFTAGRYPVYYNGGIDIQQGHNVDALTASMGGITI